jgi:tetratricopeptide (TPR) repeat protein
MTSDRLTNYRNTILILLLLLPAIGFAQTDRDYIRSGNKAYRQKQYPQAEVQYKKAISVNPENTQAIYNMGCALMMQNKASEAVKYLQKSGEMEKNKIRKAKSYHNIGVICQKGKMYSDAIKAYCEALRNNPDDNETRYNLALCQKLQKDQKDNKDNKQQNKDNKKQNDKNKDKQNKNNDDKKQDDKQDKDKDKQKQQQQQQPQMSKDNAEQLLNAAMQQEQQTQERLNKARQQQQTRRYEKNW